MTACVVGHVGAMLPSGAWPIGVSSMERQRMSGEMCAHAS